MLGTGVYINVGADRAGLCDESEFGEFLNQLSRNRGSLAVENNHFGVFESHGKLAQSFDGIGVNLCLKGVKFAGAI